MGNQWLINPYDLQLLVLLMAEIRLSPVEVGSEYPVIYRVSAPSQVVIARFQPSTVGKT